MAKLFKFLRGGKKQDKENIDEGLEGTGKSVHHRLNNTEHSVYRPMGHKNISYSHFYDEDDDCSEVTLKATPNTNPYHVVTEPKKKRGPRSFAGEQLSFKSARQKTSNWQGDNSFCSEFIPARKKKLPSPPTFSRGILKEKGNKTVGWENIKSHSKRGIRNEMQAKYNEDDDKEELIRMIQQYEDKISKLKRKLNAEFSAKQKEYEIRKHYQLQSKQLSAENEELKQQLIKYRNKEWNCLYQNQDININGDDVRMIQKIVAAMRTPSTNHFSTITGPLDQRGSTTFTHHQHQFNSVLNGGPSHQYAWSGATPPVESILTSTNQNNVLLSSKPEKFQRPLLFQDKQSTFDPSIHDMGEIIDEVKNFRSQHTDSSSESSRQEKEDKIEMENLKAGLAAVSVNTSASTDGSLPHGFMNLSPRLMSSPEVGRNSTSNSNATLISVNSMFFKGNTGDAFLTENSVMNSRHQICQQFLEDSIISNRRNSSLF